MFGVKTFHEMAAFVGGCDAATSGMLLEGFHEWLQMRLGHHTGLGWPGIVLLMTVPGWDEHSPRQLPDAE